MAKIMKQDFGITKSGKSVEQYTLENKNGMQLEIITYGGAVKSLKVPTKNGMVDIVLGFDTVEKYENHNKYMGAIVGRFANRIGQGKFKLNDREYKVYTNDGLNHLHGGKEGFDKKVWKAEEIEGGLCLTYVSPHQEEGYPGEVTIQVYYYLTDENQVIVDISAKTTQDTPINITNHTYFNLNGHEDGSILDNKLTLFSEEITQINENILPNGEFLKVKGTAFDYTEEKEIGRDVESNEPQIQFANGYDHNYVFAKERENPLKLVAKARSEKTNITMELSITQPGLQFYSGNFLDGDVGKDGAIYGKRSGFCLEPQGFADALNIKSFPNSVLKSNEAYIQKIVYKIINQ